MATYNLLYKNLEEFKIKGLGKAGIEKNMVALLDFIVQKKNITELEVCLNNFKEKMTLIKE